MVDTIKQTCNVLDRIIRMGGVVPESVLPQGDTLTMYRLTNQSFIKPVGTFLDSGETIFSITDKGMAEWERHDSRSGH
jgi:hypothetical protein